MPWNKVMEKFETGGLRSGSKKGPKVTNPKQAVAIMLSEKRASADTPEYRGDKKDALHVGQRGRRGGNGR